jgi:hypothetical protein
MQRFLRLMRVIEGHWLADLIACIGLFATGYGLMLLGYGVGLK